MFFNALVLTKKGPLGKIWLAAHYRKKLSKKDIIKVNVSESVEAILESRILLSLRTSSHLLYGISYLFNKQVSYLLSDALEYAYCVPQFITGKGIDLEEQLENLNEVNLTIDTDLAFNLTQGDPPPAPDFKLTNLANIRLQGEAAEILCDEFGDIDILRQDSRDSVHVEEILFEDKVFLDDGFGGSLNQDPTTIFDLPGTDTTQSTFDPPDDSQHHDAPIIDLFDIPTQPEQRNDEDPVDMDNIPPPKNIQVDDPVASPKAGPSGLAAPSMEEARHQSTTGVSRNIVLEEELVLDPLDESYRRPKRKRANRVIIDNVNEMSSDVIRANIREAQEREIEYAPATKSLMMAKKSLRASALLETPEKYLSAFHLKVYQSHLLATTEIVDRDDESTIVMDEDINEGRTMGIPDEIGNISEDVPMEDVPPVVPDEASMEQPPPVPEKDTNKGRKQPTPDEPEVQPSQEKAGQRRKKRPKLSQEQARRGTVHEPELLHGDSNIQFERTEMDAGPIPDDSDFLFQSQDPSQGASQSFSQSFSQSQDFQATPDDGLLSQLSQTLNEPVSFSQLTQDCNRRKAALTFFQLLALHKQSVIKLEQERYYEEIWITKGSNFRGTLYAY